MAANWERSRRVTERRGGWFIGGRIQNCKKQQHWEGTKAESWWTQWAQNVMVSQMMGNLSCAHPSCDNATAASCRKMLSSRKAVLLIHLYLFSSVRSQRLCLVHNWATGCKDTHLGTAETIVGYSKHLLYAGFNATNQVSTVWSWWLEVSALHFVSNLPAESSEIFFSLACSGLFSSH